MSPSWKCGVEGGTGQRSSLQVGIQPEKRATSSLVLCRTTVKKTGSTELQY